MEKKRKKFYLRKNDVARPNELAGVSGKIEGKLYLPYADGEEVDANESIVEMIKDGWNVPNRIPFASELKVQDGAPITTVVTSGAKGTVKYYKLIGDYLERRPDIKAGHKVVEKGLFSVIVDGEDREALRHYISRGSVVELDDNTPVEKDSVVSKPEASEQVVIAEWDPYANPTISEKAGTVTFEDIIPGITASEQFDDLTGTSKLVINEYVPAGFKPTIVLATESDELIRYTLDPKTSLFVSEGQKVEIADIIGKTPKASQKSKDITGGLPRVSELFEARRPKNIAVLASFDGVISFGKSLRNKQRIIITDDKGNKVEYLVDKVKQILVHEGEFVHAGEALTDGQVASHDVLRILGEKALHYFIVSEVQQVYRSQGVNIADKHIEVIFTQMLRQVKIVKSGDTKFIEGDLVSKAKFAQENEKIIRLGGRPSIAEPFLVGITRAAVSADSIISAASFQDTTKVLTEAAVSAKVDNLENLKENVIIGRTIPVGTGIYKDQDIAFEVLDD
jgi:DNA-directed RNA polymerase subunit beta'